MPLNFRRYTITKPMAIHDVSCSFLQPKILFHIGGSHWQEIYP